jgi:hypothetical protein
MDSTRLACALVLTILVELVPHDQGAQRLLEASQPHPGASGRIGSVCDGNLFLALFTKIHL